MCIDNHVREVSKVSGFPLSPFRIEDIFPIIYTTHSIPATRIMTLINFYVWATLLFFRAMLHLTIKI